MTQIPLITGCKGRLGRAITAIIEEEHADTMPAAVFATRDELDVTDYFRMRAYSSARFAGSVSLCDAS